ncbi:MAG: hypothetical protein ACPL1K_05105, partial [Candidatus Kryptoniota bacterium]
QISWVRLSESGFVSIFLYSNKRINEYIYLYHIQGRLILIVKYVTTCPVIRHILVTWYTSGK